MNSCRLCLKEFLLLKKSFDVHNLKDKLQTIFTFEIKPDKRLSELICPACVLTISHFYEYATQVQQNQLKLYSTIENVSIKGKTARDQISAVAFAFGSILTDFKRDLEGYEPLPNMELALKGDLFEKQKLYDVQDHLVKIYFCLNCELCGIQLENQDDRRFHFRQNHPNEKYYVSCCDQRLSTRINIMRHMNRHWKRGINSSGNKKQSILRKHKVTDSVFQSPNLEWQTKLHYKNGLPIKTTNRIRHVPAETYEKHEQEDGIIESYYKMDCELCDYTGNSYLGLRFHFQKNHNDEGFFITCCNRRFRYKCHILEHIAKHKQPQGVKCKQCVATFPTERLLKAHITRKHIREEEKLFRCDHCEASFATKALLGLHTFKHETVTCDLCGLEMKRGSIRVHKINVHKLGEEIVCHVCAKVYHSKHLFNSHYRTTHLKIRSKYKRKSRAKKRPPIADEPTETTANMVCAVDSYDLGSVADQEGWQE
ncbi:transcription factor grauzone-like [Sabethes cyaneus]|uniref:transcription factor grauzone-like n=1 Tax=Sabethes cyaneus TaxID=53552 RepID=UPI00237E86F1|nr:transcription factor grauzone-like [Sabethes cyaneus]